MSLWHCETHGLTGPMACCEKAGLARLDPMPAPGLYECTICSPTAGATFPAPSSRAGAPVPTELKPRKLGGGWNHRVIRHVDPDGTEGFQIHEVYYDREQRPATRTVEPVSPYGETLDELLEELGLFAGALDKPILSEADFSTDEIPSSGISESAALPPRATRPEGG